MSMHTNTTHNTTTKHTRLVEEEVGEVPPVGAEGPDEDGLEGVPQRDALAFHLGWD